MPATAHLPKIIVIGAGLQGLSVALCLAARGLPCTVLEAKSTPMSAASNGNEGKIHLGLVYALDHSGETGRAMLQGALSFSSLLQSWCGVLPWQMWRTSGFRYAMMPGSLSDEAALEGYYDVLKRDMRKLMANELDGHDYMGTKLDWLWRRSTNSVGSPVVDGKVMPCFDTQEVGIDTRAFASELLARIRRIPSIRIQCQHEVRLAQRQADGYRLGVQSPVGMREMSADIVINCAWADRTRLDAAVGFSQQPDDLVYRIKYRIMVQPRHGVSRLKPVTMVQGPYGDVVPYQDGSVYLSWYPLCRTYFDHSPPAEVVHDASMLDRVWTQTLTTMSEYFPDLKQAQLLSVSPCVIVAPGRQDVDDPLSQLHRRNRSGPTGQAGWWSVDTGKLTLAPLHAQQVVDMVMRECAIEARA